MVSVPDLPVAVSASTQVSAERCYVTSYKGVDIVVLDLSHTTPEQAILIMQAAGALIASLPLKSARVFTNGIGAVYSKDSLAALKEFTIHNTPYIKASAVIGADSLRAFALKAVALVTQRNIQPFSTREQALDWLAEYA